MNTFQKMLYTLMKAQNSRNERQEFIVSNNPDEKHPELGWVVYERQAMLDAVNHERKQLGLDPLPITDIVKAETQAAGYVDYTRKFALYCSELVGQSVVNVVKC